MGGRDGNSRHSPRKVESAWTETVSVYKSSANAGMDNRGAANDSLKCFFPCTDPGPHNRVKYEMLSLAVKYGLNDVREGLSTIKDAVWSCFVQKDQL